MAGNKLVIIVVLPVKSTSIHLCSILARRCADDPLETPGHVALAAKPGLDRYLGQWLTRFDQSLGVAYANAFQIFIRRHTHFGVKYAQKIIRTKPQTQQLH